MEKDILAELKTRFKPEFLNRLDEVILFDRLSQPETEDIAGRLLTAVAGRLGALGVGLSAPREAVALLARESFDGDNGARPLRRAIRSQVEEPAAELLLSHELNQGDTLCGGGGEAGPPAGKATGLSFSPASAGSGQRTAPRRRER